MKRKIQNQEKNVDFEDLGSDPETEGESGDEATETENSAETEELLPVEKKKIINLQVKEFNKFTLPSDLVRESADKLRDLKAKESLKFRTQERRNDLESLLFTTRDTLQNEQFIEFSTENERKHVEETLSTVAEWFEEEGDRANMDDTDKRIKQVQNSMDVVVKRLKETRQIPEAFEGCQAILADAIHKINIAVKERNITDEEKEEFDSLCEDTILYVGKLEESFRTKPFNKDFEVKSYTITSKCKSVETKLKILQRRPKRIVETPKIETPTPEQPETPNDPPTQDNEPSDPEPSNGNEPAQEQPDL